MLALLALLAYGIASNQTSQSIDSQLAAGKRPAPPDLTLPKLDGSGDVRLSSYKGKVVVLNFWASWCPPCKHEAPVLARWQPRLAAKNGTIVGVDVLDVSSDAEEFIREHKLDFPHLRDQDGSRLKSFQIVAYPETIVLDRQGRIAATSRGAISDKFFVQKVEPLLEERA
ncbi:MAG: cytochrome c biosis protein CcmG, thiol:disulfide interchange protein DsbE [Thermoleophilaceae bacterium]|nr:cytochrome c biosis protein CcmG, thiol:disulfide interchange protein DsbE [Thermoleophilaceae bacterium]